MVPMDDNSQGTKGSKKGGNAPLGQRTAAMAEGVESAALRVGVLVAENQVRRASEARALPN